jgi:serine/threonine protein kinase
MQVDLSAICEPPRVPPVGWVESRSGTSVGLSHRIVRLLASGGMGHVFLAEHVATGSYAAAKFMSPESEIPEELLVHEASVLKRLSHPHIVGVFESGRTFDGDKYLLLEYVRGIDLDEWMQRTHTPLARAAVLSLVGQLASAIDHVHAHDLVHGDIKPANVMFEPTANDSVKLVDFGLAFDRRDARYRRGSAGTPGYMAPEQLRGEPCGPAIDRFALAALSFELLTGRALQPWATLSRVRARARARSFPLDKRDQLSPALQSVFARGLDDQPEARFESAGAFVAALANALEREEWQRSCSC